MRRSGLAGFLFSPFQPFSVPFDRLNVLTCPGGGGVPALPSHSHRDVMFSIRCPNLSMCVLLAGGVNQPHVGQRQNCV